METWRLLVDPPAAGARNMAVDQAIAESVQDGSAPPTLRFYTWWPRALSLGYHQPLRLVDRPLAQHLGIDIVRRITGGGALLHSDELTYAVALPRRHDVVRGGIRESYAALTEGLVAGLEALGLAPRAGETAHAPEETLPGLCFASPSTHEIWVERRKMVASAQGRVHGGVLQHGSLVMSHDPDVHRVTHTPAPQVRSPGLRDVLAQPLTIGELVQALTQGFADRLHVAPEPGVLTLEERNRRDELVGVRYAHDAWLARR
ncbi:MAG: biotin/lipoate A/B protein ligase family protein [Chloroflexota bacterium]|nr:biotin/lipoate A/B protein ligase family protein [Chloroflexota bacterium]